MARASLLQWQPKENPQVNWEPQDKDLGQGKTCGGWC